MENLADFHELIFSNFEIKKWLPKNNQRVAVIFAPGTSPDLTEKIKKSKHANLG